MRGRPPKRDHFREAHFEALENQLRVERETAPFLVDRLLRETPKANWSTLVERADIQTCGALEHLANLVAESLSHDPSHVLGVAELAVSTAEAVPERNYPRVIIAQLRAYAWKDLGKALRTLSRYPEALNAFQRAEKYLEPHATLIHDQAGVWFNMAVTYQEVSRFDDALQLLTTCKSIYRLHEDTKNVVLCALAEGMLLQRLHRHREAREAYLLLLASTRDIDKASLAALHHAIGFCSIELGDYSDAEANLRLAITLHRELRATIDVLRAEAGRGRLAIRRGDVEEGIIHLRPIRRDFFKYGMPEEAGICGLEIVQGMLLRDRPEDAATLARMIIREFMNAGLNNRAITALGYLSEALAAKTATPKLVEDVREYIISLRANPEREFTATA